MSETITCPICETENPADATNCEVCGERLVPAEPGEVVPEEENVAAALAGDSEDLEAVTGIEAASEADETDEMDALDDEADELDDGEVDELDDADIDDEFGEDDVEAEDGPVESGDLVEDIEHLADGEIMVDNAEEAFQDGQVADQDAHDDEEGESPGLKGVHHDDVIHEPTSDELEFSEDEVEDYIEAENAEHAADPDFLYSPLDGSAYPRGSEEYEEGFGPNGEELVATPPDTTAASEVEEESAQQVSAEPADGPDLEFAAAIAGSKRGSDRPASREFEHAFQARTKDRPTMQPLPEPGTHAEPATLTIYMNREPVARHAIDTDEVLIGRRDPVSDSYPDLDLTEFDPEAHVSRKHAYVYRQNKNYTLYAVSNAGTQLNSELLQLGERRPLSDGDVVVVAGKIAMKFDVPGA